LSVPTWKLELTKLPIIDEVFYFILFLVIGVGGQY